MDKLNEEISKLMSNLWKPLGFSDSFCNIMSILYLEPYEISLEDLAKETNYSLASVSNTMKTLVNIGVVKKIRKPKSHKVFFYMEKDIVKLNIQKINFANEQIKQIIEVLPSIIKKHSNRQNNEKTKKKLQILQSYYKQIEQFHFVMEKMLDELRKIQNVESKVGK
ncbi:MAG: winged helix-turn-helix transcriptional regulator [Candidatus Altiarchaeota archaeon]